MTEFYTNVAQRFNKILFRGYKDGKRFSQRLEFQPRLFLPTKEDSKYRTIHGKPVREKRFESPNDMREFLKKYKDIENFDYCGMEDVTHQFIHQHFKDCRHDPKKIKVCYIDIEVDTTGGYPNMDTADKEITAITMLYDDITIAFGYGDYTPSDSKVKYSKCKHEHDMVRKFLKIWNSARFGPDVVTGWNIEFFDIPYLYRRIERILDEAHAKQLSPWKMMDKKTIQMFGRDHTAFYPVGIAVLDYINMYKKFVAVTKPQETYKLDHIAWVELGENKLDYTDYGSLHKLASENHQLFMEYNIRDCELVKRMDDKLKLLDLVYTISYSSGINLTSALGTVQQWDTTIHNYLIDQCVVVPKKMKNAGDRSPVGAFVKDPQVGRFDWVASFDLRSLYPSIIQQYNIGPDKKVSKKDVLAMMDSFSDDD
jgi:DNA polymerase elongation subunit (family B)